MCYLPISRLLAIFAFCVAACGLTGFTKDQAAWGRLLKHPSFCDAVAKSIQMNIQGGEPPSVTWKVNEAYPAASLRGKLKVSLEKDGWKPLEALVLTTESHPANAEGWSEFSQGDSPQATRFVQHLSEWQDASGAVLWCSLSYESPFKGPPNRAQVKVALAYIDPESAKRMIARKAKAATPEPDPALERTPTAGDAGSVGNAPRPP